MATPVLRTGSSLSSVSHAERAAALVDRPRADGTLRAHERGAPEFSFRVAFLCMDARWLLLFVAVGCSSTSSSTSSTPSTSSGVDTSKSLSSLSSAEKNALCDWIAQEFGGYDSRGVCADSATGGLQGPTNQSGCVDLLPPASCPATVGQFQSCIQSEVQNACDWAAVSPTPACAFLTARACGGTSDAGAE